MASHHATPVTIYLDRDGGVLRAGRDDGRTGRSALVAANGLDRLTVPAFRGGDASWSQIVTCVRDGFSAFQVDIVDRQPASGDYVTIMVGGRPGLLGYGGSVSGVAPYGARILETAVGFVFSDQLRNRPRSVCESIMHEAGHTLGLDHTYHCEDVMSYRNCGPKRFTERVVPCGEGAPRSCGNGEDSQSSFAILADNVGLREAEPEPEYEAEPEPEYEAEPEPEYEPEPDAPADGGAWLPAPGFSSIEVEVTTDRRGDRQVQITAMTTGAGISEIELAWAMPGATYLFRCSRPPVHAPVTCQRQGPVAVFTLLVGEGERGFALRVTDGRGNQAVSDPLRLR